MKRTVARYAVAAAITLCAMAGVPRLRAQQVDEAAPGMMTANSVSSQTQPNEAHMPASGETTARDFKTFTGYIVKEDGRIVLKDPVTKVSYKLDNEAKAKQFSGKRVKVTGKLDTNTNTILVDKVEDAS